MNELETGQRGGSSKIAICLLGRGASAARWASVARRVDVVVGRSDSLAFMMIRKAIPRNEMGIQVVVDLKLNVCTFLFSISSHV